MQNPGIETISQILDSYPQEVQQRAIQNFREYLEDINDELRWEESFHRTAPRLEEFGREVKRQIANGEAEDMDFGKL